MANMKDKRISVAMTTYNGANYIEDQLKSILGQTVPPEEIIVCDDCSTDSTVKILTGYHDKGLIKLFSNEVQLGVLDNFKKAVSLCKKDNYIALSDQDDFWLPNKIQLQYEAIQRIEDVETPCLVYSDLTLVDKELKVIDQSFMHTLNINPSKESLKSLLFGNFITGCTIMLNGAMKKHFLQIPKEAYMHDAWLGLVAFTFGRNQYIKEQLIKYRQHGNNVTFETNKSVPFVVKFLNNFKSIFAENIFLKSNLQMAEYFLRSYGEEISDNDYKTISHFLKLSNRTFVVKKIFSFLSRRYRYIGF